MIDGNDRMLPRTSRPSWLALLGCCIGWHAYVLYDRARRRGCVHCGTWDFVRKE